MQEVTFTLQTVTPLFLAGANPENAELRAPAFRGVMRYWLRALVGRTYSLDKLIAIEESIFGSTSTGSAIQIRVQQASKQPISFTEKTGVQQRDGTWKATGKGYLLWSMKKSGSEAKNNVKSARWYFPTNTQFTMTLVVRDQESQTVKQAVVALWLLTHLGSIGSRSRRGAGSLSVKSVGENPTTLSFATPATPPALKQHIEQGIHIARELTDAITTLEQEAEFDILSSTACRIWILSESTTTWHNSDQAMDAIGESLQDYRASINPPERRAIFGLPLILKGLQDRKLQKQLEEARKASPLLLRVTKLQDVQKEQYVGVAVLFKTKFKDINISDYALIEKWIEEDFPDALEVQL